MFLSIFSRFVLSLLFFISVRIFGFQICFVRICICCVVIEVFLIYRMINTWSFHLFPTPGLVGTIGTGGPATNSCATCEWSRLRSSLVLLFLEPIKPCTFQTTLQITLRFAMMTLYASIEIDCLLQRHQFSYWPFLRCTNDNTRTGLLRLPFILVFLWHRIDPFERLFSWFLTLELILYYLAHLGIEERVSYDHLFFLQILLEAFATLEWQVVEIEW